MKTLLAFIGTVYLKLKYRTYWAIRYWLVTCEFNKRVKLCNEAIDHGVDRLAHLLSWHRPLGLRFWRTSGGKVMKGTRCTCGKMHFIQPCKFLVFNPNQHEYNE